jgi:hypothetical protein
MILQILQRTPPWVFGLFLVLLVLGAMQSRTRDLGRARVALMPAIFLPLSFWGVWTVFGLEVLAFAAWFVAVGAAVLINRYARIPRQVSYTPATRLFHVAGSWIPLAMMMAIFFARYAIAVALAMQPALKSMPVFASAVGAAYGLMSGAFLARALRILGTAREPHAAAAAA